MAQCDNWVQLDERGEEEKNEQKRLSVHPPPTVETTLARMLVNYPHSTTVQTKLATMFKENRHNSDLNKPAAMLYLIQEIESLSIPENAQKVLVMDLFQLLCTDWTDAKDVYDLVVELRSRRTCCASVYRWRLKVRQFVKKFGLFDSR